ncbi:MAG TPA: IscS subfamily cysteine desulfurase [Polyangiaceae bacterium]
MRPSEPIYMDNHSTTRVDPRVVEAMLPYFTEHYGNAASRSHAFGWAAEGGVELARSQIARLIGASTEKEIYFTSGATESNNLALKGAAQYYQARGRHIVTTAIEHKAVLDTGKHLEQLGFQVSYVGVGASGIVDPADVRAALRDDTILVSVMLANNEVGTIQPIGEIGRITRERGVLLHCDAVQGVGRTPFDVETMNVDLVSLSAHKIYGPKGIGALYVRRSKPRVRLIAQIDGGGHERGLRSGTLNVPGIVGFGKACEILQTEAEAENARIAKLRDRLWELIGNALGDVTLNGACKQRVPGNLNVSFANVEAETLMLALQGVAVSSGSACTSASLEPSYVLRALGVSDELAKASLRFGLGRFNKDSDIEAVATVLAEAVPRLRAASTRYA